MGSEMCIRDSYYPGTYLTSDISARDTAIPVENVSLFRTDIGLKNTKPWNRRRKVNDDIVIVPLDNNGKKQWKYAEHTTLQSINESTSTLTVKRAAYNSKSRIFSKNSWIAPHVVTGPWDRDPLWAYNYSQIHTEDSEGSTTAEKLHQQFADMLTTDGELEYIKGITFDLLYYEATFFNKGRLPDINNDGVSDSGIINDYNHYSNGVESFLTRLRSTVGDNFLITSDGNAVNSQRALGLLNGIEAEGLGSFKDAYKAWPNTYNTFRYWKKFNNTRPHFNYLVPKGSSESTISYNKRISFSAGVAISLGAYVPTTININQLEPYSHLIRKNNNSKPTGWLGEQISPTQLLEPNGIKALDFTPLKIQDISPVNSDIEKLEYSLTLRASKSAEGTTAFTLKNIPVTNGTLLLKTEVKSTAPADEYYDESPNIFTVDIAENTGSIHTAEKQLSLYNSSEFFESYFHFQDINSEFSDITFAFPNIKGPVTVKLTTGSQDPILKTTYQNAVLLVNSSVLRPAYISPFTPAAGLTELPPLSARIIERSQE